MITQNTNKLRLKTKSKILVMGLILSIVMGIFAPIFQVQASPSDPTEICYFPYSGQVATTPTNTPCQILDNNGNLVPWTPTGPTPAQQAADPTGAGQRAVDTASTTAATTPPAKERSVLYDTLDDCGIIVRGSITGCIEVITYFLFVTIPSFLMGLAAQIFNFMAAMTISSNMYGLPFIQNIWTIIRDFANIFFILILLYAAFEIILGLGGGGAKKIVASVILIALVVNFSLFFTKIVIDSSNIAALIFYNKIDTSNTVAEPISGEAQLGVKEKNIGGALVSRFNINTFFDGSLMEKLKEPKISWFNPITLLTGNVQVRVGVNAYILVSMMVAYGLVVYALTYAFFTTALSFLGRMITLMMLMIISPFAFVTASVPKFKGIDTIGFDSWLKKLFQTSFVALIFMFILYIISEILREDIFKSMADTTNKQLIPTLIQLFIPAILITILLIKGTSYAKKASGEFTGAIITGAKVAAGLGGLALGGAALAGRATVGSFMKGASTGDTAANRMQGSANRIAAHQAIINNPASTIVERTQARKEIMRERKDQITGTIQQRLGVQRVQNWVGTRLNQDQGNVERASQARHDLDSAASDITHGKKKTWSELNGEERYETRRKLAREGVIRNYAAQATAGTLVDPTTGIGYGNFGTRGWEKLSQEERAAVDRSAGVGNDPVTNHAIHGGALETQTTIADTLVNAARVRQGIISSAVQSTVTGTYDVRNLANMIAREQTSGFAKFATGLTAALAMSMRGGFKQMGVNYGTPQGSFFKDLGNTISEALKSTKINVDLTHIGEEKKETGGGGHH